MYLGTVLLLLLVLPVGSVVVEHAISTAMPIGLLVGKWFVFWSVGVRLVLAGLRQLVQPRFTSETIFGIAGDTPLPFVRELGVANLAAGVVGLASLARPDFVLPSALAATIFYGLAGARHAFDADRNLNRNVAMTSDLFVALVLGAFVLSVLA